MTSAKGGRPPKPTPIKLLRGETRESRLNRRAPQPIGGGPVMPTGMSRRAQAVWRRQTRAMALSGVLTAVDADLLRAYCETVDRYEVAERKYREQGPLVAGARDGEMVKNPLHQVVRDNASLLVRLARELGFAPGAREGITVAQPDEAPDTLAGWEHRSG